MPAIATNTDLARFVLARIDDDAAELRRLNRALARNVGAADPVADGVRTLDRLSAECAAKRQIVGLMQQLLVLRDQPQERPVRDAAASVLRWLASPYAEHPSFRNEWRISTRR